MRLWQKLFQQDQENNLHKNHISCVENDYCCRTDEQLIEMLKNSNDEDVIQGITKILKARGYSKQELMALRHFVVS